MGACSRLMPMSQVGDGCTVDAVGRGSTFLWMLHSLAPGGRCGASGRPRQSTTHSSNSNKLVACQQINCFCHSLHKAKIQLTLVEGLHIAQHPVGNIMTQPSRWPSSWTFESPTQTADIHQEEAEDLMRNGTALDKRIRRSAGRTRTKEVRTKGIGDLGWAEAGLVRPSSQINKPSRCANN